MGGYVQTPFLHGVEDLKFDFVSLMLSGTGPLPAIPPLGIVQQQSTARHAHIRPGRRGTLMRKSCRNRKGGTKV